jgi:hypothetical protein
MVTLLPPNHNTFLPDLALKGISRLVSAPTWGSTRSTGAARSPDRGEIDEVAMAGNLFKIHGASLQRMEYCRGTGVGLSTLQRVMGHADWRSTQGFVGAFDEGLKLVVESLYHLVEEKRGTTQVHPPGLEPGTH